MGNRKKKKKNQRNKVSKGSQMFATQKSSQQIEKPISFRSFIKQWHLKYMRFTREISEFSKTKNLQLY